MHVFLALSMTQWSSMSYISGSRGFRQVLYYYICSVCFWTNSFPMTYWSRWAKNLRHACVANTRSMFSFRGWDFLPIRSSSPLRLCWLLPYTLITFPPQEHHVPLPYHLKKSWVCIKHCSVITPSFPLHNLQKSRIRCRAISQCNTSLPNQLAGQGKPCT